MMLTPRPPRQHGRSLVELMIAMFIGLVVMGAVVLTVSGTSMSGEQQDVQAQLNEEAAIAANLISSQLRLAGYSVVHSVSQANTLGRGLQSNYQGPPVMGCENGFNNQAGTPAAGNLACIVGAPNTAPDAISVRFEADPFNTVPNQPGGAPTDCVGQNLAANTPSQVSGAPPYALAENRYFIAPAGNGVTGLFCAGSGNFAIPRMLIANVTDMQITYGVAAVSVPNNVPLYTPTQFLTATEVAAIPGVADEGAVTGWHRVVSIQICLLMQSENNALSQPMAPFVDCRGQPFNPAANDRRLYRTIRTVIALRNRSAPCLRSSVLTANAADVVTSCVPQ